MLARHHQLLSPITLSLAGLAGLVGLAGCDALPAADTATESRGAPLWKAPLEPCIATGTVTMKHDDGTVDVSQQIGAGLATYARPNDMIEIDFSVTKECQEEHGSRVTLAASTDPGIGFGISPQQATQAWDVDTQRFKSSGGTLVVHVPDCFFQLDLAFGEPLATQGVDASYASAGRSIVSVRGGQNACSAPALAVRQFDSVQPGWGEAPVSANFGWEIDADPAAQLTCSFDFDGDGKADYVHDNCPANTSEISLAELPQHVFESLGRHRPELIVSDGARRVWAATTIYANHIEYASGVRFPEATQKFVGGTRSEDKSLLATITLEYTSTKDVPAIAVGDVIVGKADGGYMVRAQQVTHKLNTLTIVGPSVGLDQTVKSGFVGLRDVQVSTEHAHCVGTCAGEIEPVSDPPGVVAKPALALDAPNQLLAGESTYGVRVGLAAFKPHVTAEAWVGLVVKDFVLDFGFLSVDAVDIEVVPTVEATLGMNLDVFNKSVDLGRFYMGTLPLGLPVTVWVVPHVDFKASVKFSGKATFRAPVSLQKQNDAWNNTLTTETAGEVSGPDGGWSVGGSVSAGMALNNELALGLLRGPYFGPYATLGLRKTFDEDCAFCIKGDLEGGVQVGWSKPWGVGDLFDPLKLFKKIDLFNVCTPDNGPEACPQEPQDPPPGGTVGDVHAMSHDGLMFDFQAGGEFVLVRATGGAPFEVQSRQEPMGGHLALSVNTAVATVIDGVPLGVYAGVGPHVLRGGVVLPLAVGASEAVGGGTITRDASNRYTISYPTGEVVIVKHLGGHLDVAVELPEARANQVEGVLGDFDGDWRNDIGLGGEDYVPLPVTAELLYRGDAAFTQIWRVEPGHSLFDYADGRSAETFRLPPYVDMPSGSPPSSPGAAELARTACGACPPALHDACMLDVGVSGDASFAAVCQIGGTPAGQNFPSDGPIAVSPRYGAPIDCSGAGGYTDGRLVFQGPGALGAGQYPTTTYYNILVEGHDPANNSWEFVDAFQTAVPDGAWPIDCTELGGDWGECSYRLRPSGPCDDDLMFDEYRWAFSQTDDMNNPLYYAEAVFAPPAP